MLRRACLLCGVAVTLASPRPTAEKGACRVSSGPLVLFRLPLGVRVCTVLLLVCTPLPLPLVSHTPTEHLYSECLRHRTGFLLCQVVKASSSLSERENKRERESRPAADAHFFFPASGTRLRRVCLIPPLLIPVAWVLGGSRRGLCPLHMTAVSPRVKTEGAK